MRIEHSFFRFVGAITALTLAACGGDTVEDPVGMTNLGFEVPPRIRQNTAIDSSQLSADLLVNGQPVVLEDDGSGVWAAVAMVPANRNSSVKVVWYELFEGVRLRLAERTQTVAVGATGGSVSFDGTYATSGTGFDRDGDGFSNYDERSLGTSPLNVDDRPGAATMQLAITLPDDVQSLGTGYTVVASLNGSSIPLQKSGQQYSASVSDVAAGSSVDLVVLIESVKYGNLTLAREQRSVTVNSGDNTVTVNGSDFSSLFDEDNDDASNLREVLLGRNPLGTSDYVIDKTANPPLVDGILTDAAWSRRFVANGSSIEPRLINNLVLVDSGFETLDGLQSEWAAVVDDSYLYIGVRVLDRAVHFDSGIVWWKDDGVEIYLDGDNSKRPDFDGINDFHMNFRLGDQTVIRGLNGAPLPENLVFEFSTAGFDSDIAGGTFAADIDLDGTVDKGFNLEIRFLLSQLDIQPDKPFGMNVHYNDDDDGGERDSKYVWIGELGQDVDYLNPASFGTIEVR